jgi:starch-binding outer membrane protein, SusD/RagB family
MKNLRYKAFSGIALSSIILITLLNACDKNLDLSPGGSTEDMMYHSEMDFHKGIYGIYAKITDIYSFNNNNPVHFLWLLPGDDIGCIGSSPYESFNNIQTTDSKLNHFWGRSYQVIARANVVLQKLSEEKGDVIITPHLKGYITGEALFLRAWAYFNIWNLFGSNAPLIISRIESIDDVNQPSSTGTAMLDTVISNFGRAAKILPAEWPSNQLGRVTKDAAYGFLGKALVFRGDYTKNTSDYAEAITAFNNITDHELVKQFGDNFSCQTENNKESLFEFQTSISPGFDNIWLWNDFDLSGASDMLCYWGFFCPGGFNYNLPEGGNFEGFMWTDWTCPDTKASCPTIKLVNAFNPADPRLPETLQPYTSWDGGRYNDYIFAKYVMRGAPSEFLTASANNPRILRLADCILLKAEAITKSGGNLVTAVDLVNQIRARARNSGYSGPSTEPADLSTTGLTVAGVLSAIRDERLRELAGEDNHRWFDLKRWNAHGDIDLSTWTNDDNGFSSTRADFDFAGFNTKTQGKLLYPIPSDEIETNQNVTQNPGY